MCIKKIIAWFNKPDPEPIPEPPTGRKKTALLFAINNYPGSQNDLLGCLNDQQKVKGKLTTLFPGEFDIKTFSDSEVTISRYKEEVAKAISLLSPGATVVIMADSCFSGTITRFLSNPHPRKNRFFDPGLPIREIVRTRFAKRNDLPMRWITLSGCGERQTSADAYIGGSYNGAFTYYAMKTLSRGLSYREWHESTAKYLPNIAEGFDQIPGLEGPALLLDRKVFEGEVLLIHNSSHGTYVYDSEGDESDGYDEALYLYDGSLTDDEINVILQSIP